MKNSILGYNIDIIKFPLIEVFNFNDEKEIKVPKLFIISTL